MTIEQKYVQCWRILASYSDPIFYKSGWIHVAVMLSIRCCVKRVWVRTRWILVGESSATLGLGTRHIRIMHDLVRGHTSLVHRSTYVSIIAYSITYSTDDVLFDHPAEMHWAAHKQMLQRLTMQAPMEELIKYIIRSGVISIMAGLSRTQTQAYVSISLNTKYKGSGQYVEWSCSWNVTVEWDNF